MRKIVVNLGTRIILLAAVLGAGWAHLVFAQSAADEPLPEGLGVTRSVESSDVELPCRQFAGLHDVGRTESVERGRSNGVGKRSRPANVRSFRIT